MKILVTGGAGFIGSHAAVYYAQRGDEVICFDNLSRFELLKKQINKHYNWDYLKKYPNIERIQGDVREKEKITEAAKDANAIIHTAAQTAVTTSVEDPRTDFEVNAIGTFNVLEAARQSKNNPAIVFCSTNKVYGDNVNNIGVKEGATRYMFEEEFKNGISDKFSIDLCEHTPYGCSKLAADLYVQDYGLLYGLRTAVFRMSCIYGTRQFGVEDQGWLAWFAIATILDKPVTIYGDGKQVRDVLYVEDLIKAYDAFIQNKAKVKNTVLNMGGGPENTLSLLELIDLLEQLTKKRTKVTYSNWRPSDQKVYISDISKAKEVLNWKPTINPEFGVRKLVTWVDENKKAMA